MPPPSKPPPLPTNHLNFDTWNSSSTGHQIADPGSSRGNTSWRETRREKLTRQFGAGRGDCTYDSDGEKKGEWVVTQIPAELQKKKENGRRNQQQRDIRSMFGMSKPIPHSTTTTTTTSVVSFFKQGCEISSSSSLKRDATSLDNLEQEKTKKRIRIDHQDNNGNKITDTNTDTESISRRENNASTSTSTSTSTIFSSLTIHINGQTTPTVSDHKLKHLLISHGANLSLHMHRGVTHVILGEPNTPSSSSSSINPGIKVAGAGGGLAAGKLQKEIQRGGWKGVKLVRVQWAMDSIAAGKRLSEVKYAVQLRTNQRSVLAFTSSTSNTISSLS
ncbi:hypothetical protein BO83DRAFT_420117 [Aspergillus eucalypticola CBS 122712]|uniref:BRCT domain-containing protein n=1 Tax=Aspergillus eucalypticola (strain CBS 122712 / IBT 29274) TaxID=1448314 RepID=A0A317UUM8_ASPEC|nr:uncharacterized protein BO83DRAFT_420117 [Aspergillus eucalypticola CBS 122712]PWY65161.1 hypothetical protein BO83DRAFT_420117 [Aspergillus eucalypticola CBS 122712]